jgi:hypothetical protein
MRGVRALALVVATTFCVAAGAAPLLEVGEAAEVTADGPHRLAITDAARVRPELDLTPCDAVFSRHRGMSFRSAGDAQNRPGHRIEQTDSAVPDDLKLELRDSTSDTILARTVERERIQELVGIAR